MFKRQFLLIVSILICITNYAQTFSGTLSEKDTQKPVSFVNIGIAGKSIGTVSHENGYFLLDLSEALDTDTILFSCIGYQSKKISVADFKKQDERAIQMAKKVIELKEVVVRPNTYIRKNLGSTTRFKLAGAGFHDNKLGYEAGVLMKTRRPVFLEQLNINIAINSYDSLLYRINVYEVKDSNDFHNILTTPIYLKLSAEDVKETIEFDLRPYNIRLTDNFLITLEHITDLGEGNLYFCSGFGRTYYRKTSQADWESVPVSIGMNVDVLEERRRR